MSHPEQLELLKQHRVREWNHWRASERARSARMEDYPGATSVSEILRGRPHLQPWNSNYVDLSGAVLPQASLREVDLSHADLVEADLSGADLCGADLSYANLAGANLNGCNLQRAFLMGVHAPGSKLSGADLTRACIEKADLSSARLDGARLDDCMGNGAVLKRAGLKDASLRRAQLEDADLSAAVLDAADAEGVVLNRSSLTEASLREATLVRAHLVEANLRQARLDGANLQHAVLQGASLVLARFNDCCLDGAEVFGCSAWNVDLTGASQKALRVTRPYDPAITVDDLEVAQFIHLLLRNDRVRGIIETVGQKVVLILGRFTPERKAVLDALRDTLRIRNFTPVVFDFEKPDNRDLTETITTLAHLSRFVIADITQAKSIPQELRAIVPNLPTVPMAPIMLEGEESYAMFRDFGGFLSVLPVYRYESVEALLGALDEAVIGPVMRKAQEIADRRAKFEAQLRGG